MTTRCAALSADGNTTTKPIGSVYVRTIGMQLVPAGAARNAYMIGKKLNVPKMLVDVENDLTTWNGTEI
ncbi:MAG: hypothetical protein AAFZ63_00795 [Bacteroidota bacterium]